MSGRGSVLQAVVLFTAAAVFPAVVAAQSYGPDDQVLVISAADLHPFNGSQPFQFFSGDGYMYGEGSYYAPVHLPTGAEITLMCLYARDPDGPSLAAAYLNEVKLPAGGQSPGVTTIGSVTADFDFGYGTVCTDSLSYVVHETDADGEHLSLQVLAATAGNAALGGFRIIWHRQVSDPPPVSSFDDVPLGSTYSKFIEALKAAGITAGCQQDPPLFCPDRPITRAEMATYLSIALGLHWAQ